MALKQYVQIAMQVAPTDPNHVVRYQDLVEYVQGLTIQSVHAVLTTDFGGAYNSTLLTLTQNTPTAFTPDGYTPASGDRILITGQTDKTQNGIYVVTTVGDGASVAWVLTRSADMNTSAELTMSNGLIIPVINGTDYAGTRWIFKTATIPAVLDTTEVEITQQITDTTEVEFRTFTIVGDGSTTSFNFTHNFGTLNVQHEIYDPTTGETVVTQFYRSDANACSVQFGVPLPTGTTLILVVSAQIDIE